jgi:hypothetical protein
VVLVLVLVLVLIFAADGAVVEVEVELSSVREDGSSRRSTESRAALGGLASWSSVCGGR